MHHTDVSACCSVTLEKRRSGKPDPCPEPDQRRLRQEYLEHRKMLQHAPSHLYEAHPIDGVRKSIDQRQNDLQKILSWIRVIQPQQQRYFRSHVGAQDKLNLARRKLIVIKGIIAEHDRKQKANDIKGIADCLYTIQECLDQYQDLITRALAEFR